MTQLPDLTAAELLDRFRDKSLSPVAVTEAVLDRISAWEPHIHATYGLDAELALSMARSSERRWSKGAPQGALDGVPVTVKENIATSGVPSPLGSAATLLKPAIADAPPVARLREAGAVFLCKTTMPDFGMLATASSSYHALTRNPWDLTKNTGGSSSGAGAAAAAGYGPLHVGTDIGGSIRIPASFCGVFGLKPSLGRVPIDPPFPGRVAGPMTRTTRDAALLMSVLSHPDRRDHMSLPAEAIDWLRPGTIDPRKLRIGLWLDPGHGVEVDTEVKSAIVAAAQEFEHAGANVEIVDNWLTPAMLRAVAEFTAVRIRMDTAAIPAPDRQRMHALLRQAAESSMGTTVERLYAIQMQLMDMRRATVAATSAFDYVLSPVAAHLPFAAEAPCADPAGLDLVRDVLFTCAYNISEQPAASVNCGYAKNGLPIGLQIAGRRFDDPGVLRVSQLWEEMWSQQRPWPNSPVDVRTGGNPISAAFE